MAVFEEKEKPKISETKTKKHEIPSGLWVKCKQCGEIIYSKELIGEREGLREMRLPFHDDRRRARGDAGG